MSRYFIFICLMTYQIPLFAQGSAIERNRFDSLRKVFPSLHDTTRVDIYNEMAWAYWDRFHGYNDTTYHYALKANQESVKIGYQYGKALSLIQLAWFEARVKINMTTARAYIDEAIQIGETINSDKVLGRAYWILSKILIANSEKGDKVKWKEWIECMKKSLSYFQKAGDREGEMEVTTMGLCMEYINHGQYDEAFDYCDRCVKLAKFVTPNSSRWHNELVQWAFGKMGELYIHAGDYQTHIDYVKQADYYGLTHGNAWRMDIAISIAFCKLGVYDSALYYWHRWEKDRHLKSPPSQAWGDNILGEIYLNTKRYDEALKLFEASNEKLRKTPEGMPALGNSLLLTAKAHLEKKELDTALKYVEEGLSIAKEWSVPIWMIEGSELLSEIYRQMGKDDLAYLHLRNHTLQKDSLLNRQYLWRLNTYKKIAEEERNKAAIELLSKDNQIKDEQLKQENLLKKFLMAGLASLALISIFIFRTLRLKQKNERLKRERLENELKVQLLESQKHEAELRQQASELEMQALRAQMSPHFIFNCLSSINRFILKNESEAASDYLTRFSRLIRLVLINSKQSLISLEDELEMLWLYIEMERLRFQNSFEFNITFKNEIDASSIYIPPLLLQPFAENAIWHGLMNKDGDKLLEFSFATNESELICSITDNGVGRQKAQELKSKKDVTDKSMGLQITANRLAIFNKESNHSTSFQVEDLFDLEGNASGTKVTLKIRTKDIWKTPATLESVA